MIEEIEPVLKEAKQCVYCYQEMKKGSPFKETIKKSGEKDIWHPECYRQYLH